MSYVIISKQPGGKVYVEQLTNLDDLETNLQAKEDDKSWKGPLLTSSTQWYQECDISAYEAGTTIVIEGRIVVPECERIVRHVFMGAHKKAAEREEG